MTFEQAPIGDDGEEIPFFIMNKDVFLVGMKPKGNMDIMKSPSGLITNIIHAPGKNINLPQSPRHFDSI